MRISFLLQECTSLLVCLFSEIFKCNSEIYGHIGDVRVSLLEEEHSYHQILLNS